MHSQQPMKIVIIDDDGMLINISNLKSWLYCIIVTVAIVRFSAPVFTAVEENEVVSVCVMLIDNTERNLTLILYTNDYCE